MISGATWMTTVAAGPISVVVIARTPPVVRCAGAHESKATVMTTRTPEHRVLMRIGAS